jgi:hypothetical protein
MRITPSKLVAVIVCTTSLSLPDATPANARGIGLGGVLGLVAAPLHMITRGVLGGVPIRRTRGAPPHAVVAAPEPPKPPPATTEATEPARTEGRSEARLEPARDTPQIAAQRQPPLAWPEASPSVYEDLLGYILWRRITATGSGATATTTS